MFNSNKETSLGVGQGVKLWSGTTTLIWEHLNNSKLGFLIDSMIWLWHTTLLASQLEWYAVWEWYKFQPLPSPSKDSWSCINAFSNTWSHPRPYMVIVAYKAILHIRQPNVEWLPWQQLAIIQVPCIIPILSRAMECIQGSCDQHAVVQHIKGLHECILQGRRWGTVLEGKWWSQFTYLQNDHQDNIAKS